VEKHRSAHPVEQKESNRRAALRIFPIAIALSFALVGSALAASESAKMTGKDNYATGPSRHRAQSAKMHQQNQTQNPKSQSGRTSADTD
jgi:hypothetical protein